MNFSELDKNTAPTVSEDDKKLQKIARAHNNQIISCSHFLLTIGLDNIFCGTAHVIFGPGGDFSFNLSH